VSLSVMWGKGAGQLARGRCVCVCVCFPFRNAWWLAHVKWASTHFKSTPTVQVRVKSISEAITEIFWLER
jgi:hypothetical protein